jgi:PBP1b-binding outer membrane lipoprotein LpoB
MKLKITVLAFLVLLYCCKTPYYISEDYKKHAKQYPTIAVLPVNVVITGKRYESLSIEDKTKLISNHSQIYQAALESELLRNTGKHKRWNFLKFTSSSIVNSSLSKIDSGQLKSTTPQDIGKMLSADIVVVTNAYQNNFFSDDLALGIDIVRTVLINSTSGFFDPFINTNTDQVSLDMSIIRVSTGEVIFNDKFTGHADYNSPGKRIIERYCRRIARNFASVNVK